MEAIDKRRYAPATLRNRNAIHAVLERHLPAAGVVLEVASGSGEHICHFARISSPDLVFQPSDPDSDARASIDAWSANSGLLNLRPALALDAEATPWPIARAEAVICINMIHIAPWEATLGLMRGAAAVLPPEGLLYLYGPYRRFARHTAPSNQAFDDSLRMRNPAWGVRDLEAVVETARLHGLTHPHIEEMPANNLSLVFRRSA